METKTNAPAVSPEIVAKLQDIAARKGNRAAVAAGFRVFHVSPEKPDGTVECLADSAGMTCEKCRLCDGRFRAVAPAFGQQPTRALPSVWINPHGSKAGKASAVAMSN